MLKLELDYAEFASLYFNATKTDIVVYCIFIYTFCPLEVWAYIEDFVLV